MESNMANRNSSVRFHLNFADKQIVGTKASYDKAGKGYGPIYDELVALMAKHPDFACVVVAPKEPAKPKQTYKGMDIAFMRDFLMANDDSTTLKRLDDVVAYAKATGKSKYPLAKRVFFAVYDCFDYVDAKRMVDEYRHQRTLANAKAMAEKNTALAKAS